MTRELPYCNHDPKRYVELPLGNFVVQPVGSTAYCKGLHVHTHLAGEEEAVPGVLSFGARLEPDGTVTWSRRQPTYKVTHERADEILEVALGLARAWLERDPSHCAFYYLDLAREELYRWRREMRQERRSQDHLAKCLSDPEAPQTRNQQNEEGEWEEVQLTEEERTKLRALWTRNHQRSVDKLASLHAENDDRITQLESIAAQCRAFMQDTSTPLLPFPKITGVPHAPHC